MKLNELLQALVIGEHGINLNDNISIFTVEKDRFHCRTINSLDVTFLDDHDFSLKLQESLKIWEQDGTRAVWVKVAIQHASLVPYITELDFNFHHAQRDYVMLKKWLPQNEVDNTPNYAAQYLGCAGFVINSRNEVLVVQEKFHTKKHWKLPGGHADPGEDIGEAAAREVWEETGIRSRFQCVMCFRHQHNYKHGCSDFYFVCLMTALNENICKGDNEISDCRWMSVPDFIKDPNTAEINRHIAESYVKLLSQGSYTLAPTKVPSMSNSQVMQLVYSVQPCLIDSSKNVSVLKDVQSTIPEEDSEDEFDAPPLMCLVERRRLSMPVLTLQQIREKNDQNIVDLM